MLHEQSAVHRRGCSCCSNCLSTWHSLPFHAALSAFPWDTLCLSRVYSLPFLRAERGLLSACPKAESNPYQTGAICAFPYGSVCLSIGHSLPFTLTPQPPLALSAEPPTVSASPFANQAMGSMSDLPSTSGANVASTSAMPQRYSNTDFGPDINLWYQPSSDAVTRAGDVLGMPHLDGYTAKVGPFSFLFWFLCLYLCLCLRLCLCLCSCSCSCLCLCLYI